MKKEPLSYFELTKKEEYEDMVKPRKYEESIFLIRYQYSEFLPFHEDKIIEWEKEDVFQYEVNVIKWGVYGLVKHLKLDRHYEKVEERGFEAKEVYQKTGEELTEYLLCYEDRIVEIKMRKEEKLTEEGKSLIFKRLGERGSLGGV